MTPRRQNCPSGEAWSYSKYTHGVSAVGEFFVKSIEGLGFLARLIRGHTEAVGGTEGPETEGIVRIYAAGIYRYGGEGFAVFQAVVSGGRELV